MLHITELQFNNAVMSNGYPRPEREKYNNFMDGLGNSRIDSEQEAAMALAQFIHESGGLRQVQEAGHQGQGYYGRGYIQLTHDYNYRAASIAIFGDANVLLEDPNRVVREDKLCWAVSFYYWDTAVHPVLQNLGDNFGATTCAINGALECHGANVTEGARQRARNRFDKYQKVREAFGLPPSGGPGGCARQF